MKENVKHAGAIIASVAALVTAISSCNESMEQSELKATQKIYGVVGKKIEEIEARLKQKDRDDVELRAYLDGYREAIVQLERHKEKEVGERKPPRPRAEPRAAPPAVRVLPPPPKLNAPPKAAQLPAFGDVMMKAK